MSLLAEIAQQRTNEVIYTSVSLSIEKIASEAARELLKDPAFRADLKAIARESFRRAVRDLRKPTRRRRKRRRRAR